MAVVKLVQDGANSFASNTNVLTGPGHDADPGFNEALYLVMNPDVAAMLQDGTLDSAYHHWMSKGGAKADASATVNDPQYYQPPTYNTLPPSAEEMALFSPQTYLANNPDVGQADTSFEWATEHWVRYGRFEGRTRWPLDQVYARRKTDFGRMLRKPFGINFYAPLSTRSGLGTAARGYLAAMQAAGIPVHVYNLNFDMAPSRITTRDYDTPATYRVNIIQANADTIGHVYNLFRLGHFDDAYTIAIWAWELGLLRPDWFGAFAACDEVWALSEFNTAAITAISPVPVRTMNCVVARPKPAQGAPVTRAELGLPDGFLFLAAFDVGSSLERKNPQATVDAFTAAFGGRTDVHLVLKLHSGHENPAALESLLRSVRKTPNIIVRAGKFSDAEMRGLQQSIDCYVSAHRSEGFGLNIAECMALEKPVITTGYSGNMDFTTEENSFLLSYRLRAIEAQCGPYLPGYLWADPDQDDLVRAMKRVVEDPAEASRRARLGAECVRNQFSPQAVGTHLKARLDELGLREKIPAFVGLAGASRNVKPSLAAPARTNLADIQREPTISVIVPVYNVDAKWLIACIESVRAQTYPHWQLCLCDDASTRQETVSVLRRYQGIDPRICIVRLPKNGGISVASNAAACIATGSYLLMLDNDDELTTDALHHMASAVAADPAIDVLYADEDKILPDGKRGDHYYKPDWSPEHLESVMYTLHPLTVRTRLFLDLGGFRADYSGAQDYDLMLRASRRTNKIHHIARLLYHWRMIPGSASAEVDAKPTALLAARAALADHVKEKYGDAAEVLPTKVVGLFRVRHVPSTWPETTLVITTNNGSIDLPGRDRFRMVDNFIRSIQAVTDYPSYRILVVDNRNSSQDQIDAYTENGIKLVSYPGAMSPFNYAAKANFALRHVETEHLVMLNDDMEADDPDWLRALIEFSANPEIGAVGAKLLHADGTIQHAGVVLGIGGGPAHIYHGFPENFVGYNGFTHVIRNYSVVTGACLATRRSAMMEVGGFDTAFAIDYNDIDLCLRLRRHGYRIVYTPFATLKHFEGQTERRTKPASAETGLFLERWNREITEDPYYNVNLSRISHDFASR